MLDLFLEDFKSVVEAQMWYFDLCSTECIIANIFYNGKTRKNYSNKSPLQVKVMHSQNNLNIWEIEYQTLTDKQVQYIELFLRLFT